MPYQMQIAKPAERRPRGRHPRPPAGPATLVASSSWTRCKFLVVDEADRMLDLGFSEDLAEVNQLTIERQQTMMFSATFAPRIQQLAQRVMREPKRIHGRLACRKSTPTSRQSLFWADEQRSTSASCWTTGCVTPASTRRSCSRARKSSATASPPTCSRKASSAVALHGALSRACATAA
jgi:superfamily II DNA/RNA helicase